MENKETVTKYVRMEDFIKYIELIKPYAYTLRDFLKPEYLQYLPMYSSKNGETN